MGIFDLFKSAKPFQDPELGTFEKIGKNWKGSISLPKHGELALLVEGEREGPDEKYLAVARELRERIETLLPAIETALYEKNYLELRDAVTSGELEFEGKFPEIASADGVWKHVDPQYALVSPMQGVATVEIAYQPEWEQEHTPAAIIQDWRLIELNGSVAAPITKKEADEIAHGAIATGAQDNR